MPAMKPLSALLSPGLLVLLALGSTAWAQEPSSQPASRPNLAEQERLDALVALIEGPHLPVAARRTGARELLLQDWPNKVKRMSAILGGADTAARIAVALALTDAPQQLDGAYIDPLMTMLADADAEVRRAAAMALAGFRDDGVIPRLKGIMLAEAQPRALRLAAIDALGMMTVREAAAALVEGLGDSSAPICQSALQAFERATATSFQGDVTQARAWWEQCQGLSLAEWQRQQIERLVRKDRDVDRRLRDLEARLVRTFREEYIRAPEPERAALLPEYLKDESVMVRLLGLDLVQSHLGEGKTLPPGIVAQVRGLLADVEPDVRVAAVQAVARFRDAADADRFLAMLAHEHYVEARRALVNGLGYIGSAAVVEPLVAVLNIPGDACLKEAVGAVGRLAERGVLDAERAGTVAEALLATFARITPQQVALRERVLWAMSLMADPRFSEAFVAALAEAEAVTVRQAAIRGIATLKDARLADALIPATADAELSIRKAAVEALAGLAAGDEQLAALWARLDPAREPDEDIRKAAWGGAAQVLSNRPVAEVEQWIGRLPQDGAERAQRVLELLGLVESALAKVPEARGELGRIRAQIAAQGALLGQTDEAVAGYLAALQDLHAAQSGEIPRVSLELLRFALINGRYDEAVAAALANGNPPLDGMMLWNGIKGEIEQRLAPETVDEALAMLAALKAHPPAAFSTEVTQAIEDMLRRGAAIKNPPPTSAPASQPASQPASRPTSQPVPKPG